MAISNKDAAQLAEQYFSEHSEDLLADDSDLAKDRWVRHFMPIIEQPSVVKFFMKDSRPAEEILEQEIQLLLGAAKLDPAPFDAVQELVEAIRGASTISLPPSLQQWSDALDSGHISRPRRHGPSKYKRWGRDLHIAMLIYHLEQQGVTPTRNDVSQTTSGCDIAVTALSTAVNLHMTYDAVKQIWKRYSNLKDPLADIK